MSVVFSTAGMKECVWVFCIVLVASTIADGNRPGKTGIQQEQADSGSGEKPTLADVDSEEKPTVTEHHETARKENIVREKESKSHGDNVEEEKEQKHVDMKDNLKREYAHDVAKKEKKLETTEESKADGETVGAVDSVREDKGEDTAKESREGKDVGSSSDGKGDAIEAGKDSGKEEDKTESKNEEVEKKAIYLSEEEEPDHDKYLEAMEFMYSVSDREQKRAYELLKVAADNGNSRALEKIGLARIFGAHLQRNFTQAYEIFSGLAKQGHPVGQHGLAFMYAAGLGMKSNQAKSLVNYVFAALGGHTFSQIVMGHKSHLGIGVVESCEAALAYYHKAAKEVIKKASLITGGNLVGKVRLLDEEDAVPNIYGVSDDDIVQYQSIFSDSGNTGAQLMLGLYYMFGVSGAQKSFKRALEFLNQAAREGLPTAHNLMAKIYTEGSIEVAQDYDKAYTHFKKAADQKHGDGYSGLGMLYLNGYGVKKDLRKAKEYFMKGSEKGSSDGQYYLGKMYLDGKYVQRDMSKAVQYLQLASHGGHLHAIYLLGELHADGTIIKRNCHFAVELLKSVSERGKYIQMFTEAHRLHSQGDIEAAFLMYLFLAELGFEVAQSNVAYILEQGDLTFIDESDQKKRAMLYWNRAAGQGYTQARVKLGDYYYYGMGTEVSWESAAAQYRIASDKLSSPQAMFNLGYMYEHGEGVEKDYHLAKRYYDMAAETSGEAIIPVNLALLKLNLVNMMQHYDSWMSLWPGLGTHWDLYLISVLAGVVIILVIWRTRH